jgi:hypothetical protein
MDRSHAETTAVESVTKDAYEQSQQQLSELQLVVVAGGIADTILA